MVHVILEVDVVLEVDEFLRDEKQGCDALLIPHEDVTACLREPFGADLLGLY